MLNTTASWFFGVVTFRTVIAAITFFGLVGLAGQSADLSTESTLVVATLSAVGAMFAVHSMMRGLHRLKSDGTARIERAVGQSGTVYLRIPGPQCGRRQSACQRAKPHDGIPGHDQRG